MRNRIGPLILQTRAFREVAWLQRKMEMKWGMEILIWGENVKMEMVKFPASGNENRPLVIPKSPGERARSDTRKRGPDSVTRDSDKGDFPFACAASGN